MDKWTISGVSDQMESDISLSIHDRINAFLTENGVSEGNPILEYIDYNKLKTALNEQTDLPPTTQVEQKPPPAMVSTAQAGNLPLGGRRVHEPQNLSKFSNIPKASISDQANILSSKKLSVENPFTGQNVNAMVSHVAVTMPSTVIDQTELGVIKAGVNRHVNRLIDEFADMYHLNKNDQRVRNYLSSLVRFTFEDSVGNDLGEFFRYNDLGIKLVNEKKRIATQENKSTIGLEILIAPNREILKHQYNINQDNKAATTPPAQPSGDFPSSK